MFCYPSHLPKSAFKFCKYKHRDCNLHKTGSYFQILGVTISSWLRINNVKRLYFLIKVFSHLWFLFFSGVYTKNRNFRLYKCVKLGKGNPLVLSESSRYVVKMPRGKMMSEDKKLFLDSLITNIK